MLRGIADFTCRSQHWTCSECGVRFVGSEELVELCKVFTKRLEAIWQKRIVASWAALAGLDPMQILGVHVMCSVVSMYKDAG